MYTMAKSKPDITYMIDLLHEEKARAEAKLTQELANMSSYPSLENHTSLCNASMRLLKVHEQIRSWTSENGAESKPVATMSMPPPSQALSDQPSPQHSPLASRASSEQIEHEPSQSPRQANTAPPRNATEQVDGPPRTVSRHPGLRSIHAQEYREETSRVPSAARSFAELPFAFPGTIYTHVVLLDGTPVQLKCYVCKATRGKHANRNPYFFGTKGYQFHMRSHSSEFGLPLRQILGRASEAKCLVKVDEDDAHRIRNGKRPRRILRPSTGIKQERGTDERENIDHRSDSENITRGISMQETFHQLDAVRYPTVIYVGGQWVEMWCYFCGANVRIRHEWYAGMTGFLNHALKQHKKDVSQHFLGERVTMSDIAKLNTKRPLSSEDVQLIQEGKEPRQEIIKYYDFYSPIVSQTLRAHSPAKSRAQSLPDPSRSDPVSPIAESIMDPSSNHASITANQYPNQRPKRANRSKRFVVADSVDDESVIELGAKRRKRSMAVESEYDEYTIESYSDRDDDSEDELTKM